ncbi:MAG: hypothetical protein ABIO39_05760 [Caulobacteraceae bacterium]
MIVQVLKPPRGSGPWRLYSNPADRLGLSLDFIIPTADVAAMMGKGDTAYFEADQQDGAWRIHRRVASV